MSLCQLPQSGVGVCDGLVTMQSVTLKRVSGLGRGVTWGQVRWGGS